MNYIQLTTNLSNPTNIPGRNLKDSCYSCDSCSKKTFAYVKLTTNLPNPTNIYHVATYKIRQIRAISVRKKHSRMNYIQLTTNLPNPTNIYRVATYKIRQIRAISVRKKYIRVC